jgi:hypothetical protein
MGCRKLKIHEVEMTSTGIMFMAGFLKLVYFVQKLKGVTDM